MDTRNHQLESTTSAPAQLASSSSTTEAAATATDLRAATTDAKTRIAEFSVQDFEQLIYANALAKRPEEAEQAFNLMEVSPLLVCYHASHQLTSLK